MYYNTPAAFDMTEAICHSRATSGNLFAHVWR